MVKKIRIVVRPVEPTDIPAIVAVAQDNGYSVTEHMANLKYETIKFNPDYNVQAALVDGTIVGVLCMHNTEYFDRVGHYVTVTTIMVALSQKGKGIAASLFRAADKWAKDIRALEVMVQMPLASPERNCPLFIKNARLKPVALLYGK